MPKLRWCGWPIATRYCFFLLLSAWRALRDWYRGTPSARRGIIVKGGGALETIARAKTLVLDKTGTVTAGAPVVTGVECFGNHDAVPCFAWRRRWSRFHLTSWPLPFSEPPANDAWSFPFPPTW